MSGYNRFVEGVMLPFGDAVLGTEFIKELKRWRSIQWYDKDRLDQMERSMLRNLLRHATQHVKHYRNLDVPVDSVDPFGWLRSFPILHKKDIKGNVDDFIFGNRRTLIKESSSGSSGIQGDIYMSRRESLSAQALQTLLWEWAGYRLGDRLLQLGMTTNRGFIKRAKDVILRTNYQQAFNLQPTDVNRTLRSITTNDYFFGGYASGLYSFALMANKPCEFKSIISWGDKMFSHYRKKLETVFNARVFDVYGCTEGFVIAGQCGAGNYHILSPHVKVELVNEKGEEVTAGTPGYVLITRLDAFSMPLIRYYVGDLAVREYPGKQCACGRELPMLKQIIGRDTDLVRTPSGKILIVHFFTAILEHFAAIKQFRIVQEQLDHIILEYIPEPDIFTQQVLDTLANIICDKSQEKLIIKFRQVNVIEPTPSGKPQIIKSSLQ